MSAHDDIAAIEAAAAEFAPPPVPFAVLTVGEIKFYAYDDDAEDGDIWLRNPDLGISFCRNADGTWYCVAGGSSCHAATPELALGKVLHFVARNMRALTSGGVSLEMRGAP